MAEKSSPERSLRKKVAETEELWNKAKKWLQEQQFEPGEGFFPSQCFFGTVYPARSQHSDLAVAVKFSRSFSLDSLAQEQATLNLLSYQPHSNIVLVTRMQFWGGPFWMSAQIFELPFSDLEHQLKRFAVDSPSAGLFARDTTAGLAHLHRLGVEHRDLKPANLMIYTLSGSRVQLRIGNFRNSRPGPELWTGSRYRSRSPEVASKLQPKFN